MSNSLHGISRLFAGLMLTASAAFLLTPAALAQGGAGGPFPGPRLRGGFGPGGFGPGGFGHRGAAKVVTGEPYTAQAVTTHTQTLSNGTTINHQTTVSLARDSSGRTMRSETFTSGPQSGATVVSIFDPVANERIEYNTKTKKARVFVLPSGAASQANSGPPPAERRAHFHSSQVSVQTQSLSPQTIAGVSAQGKQTTRTIAAGAMGNSAPLVSTSQVWYSDVLKIVVQSTRSDPRDGQTTYVLNNLNQNEPAESLFQVPSGYQTQTITVPPRHSAGE